MDHVLMVHAGIPKTGTTSLQRFLYENRVQLERYGWCYPDLRKELPNIHSWPDVIIKNVIFYKEAEKKEDGICYIRRGDLLTNTKEWDEIWKQLLIHLEDNNVIISDESLWYDIDTFLLEAKKKYNNIKLVVYLRKQDRSAESMWNQRIKGRRHCIETLWEFIDTDAAGKEIDSMEGFHYLKRLNRIGEIIGDSNVIVRVFEKQQFKEGHGLEEDFLSILGIQPSLKEWKSIDIQNMGLSGNFVELKRIFNSTQPREYINFEILNLENEFVKLSGAFGKEETLFSDENRKEFLKQFEFENREIAIKYLHRKSGALFYEKNKNHLQQRTYICTPLEEDIARLFFTLVCAQYKEIIRLKMHHRILTEKLLLHESRGRDILLFGAGQKCRELLKERRLPVTIIADNDKEKTDKILEGIRIIYAGEITDWTKYFVIVTCVHSDEIELQLEECGLIKDKNYVLAKEYFADY